MGFLVVKVILVQVFRKVVLPTLPFIVLLILRVNIRSFTIDAGYLSALQIVQTGSGPYLPFCSVDIESSSPECEVA